MVLFSIFTFGKVVLRLVEEHHVSSAVTTIAEVDPGFYMGDLYQLN